VSYLHAGGIDRPLSIWKEGVGSVRPHQNWRGQFARGTWGAGPLQGRSSDCAYAAAPDCIPLPWPGYRTNAWHQESRAGDPEYWMGSMVDGMRDVTGQIYMRNRYYDPATGQFTQPDPIGLGGGLNSYGFAAGDPVSYADPYGLCPSHLVQAPPVDGSPEAVCPGGLTHDEYNQIEAQTYDNMSNDAGHRIRLMLESSRIQMVHGTHYGQPAEAEMIHWGIRITPEFFTGQTADEGGWMLVHELGHNIQWAIMMLISEIGTGVQSNETLMRQRFNAPPGSALHNLVQDDANRYACANTFAHGKWAIGICTP
jgi:RHS repeat-associated protein